MTDVPARAERVSEHRPPLDALRAIAVYLIVLFHAGSDRFTGGFVGFDASFVLSGYLLTGVLLHDLRDRGSISFARFYARRFRRLLPIAMVVLLVTAVVWTAVASGAEVRATAGGFRASFLGYANWFFIRESAGGFVGDVQGSPVLSFWAVAIEEQFAFLWPLLLGGIFAVAGRSARRNRFTVIVVAVAASASLAWALHLGGSDESRAYLGTDARAYQLLAGALLALTIHRLAPRMSALAARVLLGVGVLALIVLATSLLDPGGVERGLAAAMATAVVIVAVESAGARRGLVARVMSSAPAVYLGKISYGTYLWHWPIIVVAARETAIGPVGLAAVTVLTATGLGSLGYEILERPVRVSAILDRARVPVIAVGLSVSLVAGVWIVPALRDRASNTAVELVSTDSVTGSAAAGELDWRKAGQDIPALPTCVDGPAERCVVVRGDGDHLLLVGDSQARMLIPAFEEIARAEGLTFSVVSGPSCPWQADLYYPEDAAKMARCKSEKSEWYDRVIPELDPDIVVGVDRPVDDRSGPLDIAGTDGRALSIGDAGFAELLRRTSDDTLDRLRADGRKLVVIDPTPIAPRGMEPLECLSDTTTLDKCRYVATAEPTPIEEHFRELAARDRIVSLDLDALVCPYLPICDPVIGGQIVKRDSLHLTGTYARGLAPEIQAALEEQGVLGD